MLYTVEIMCPFLGSTAQVYRDADYDRAKREMAYYASKYGVLARIDWGPVKSVAWIAGRCRGGMVKK